MARLNNPALTPGQAQYVLQRLIAERRISATEVKAYLGEIDREIQTLEQRLAALRGSRQESTPTVAPEATPARARRRAAGAGRKRRATAGAQSAPAAEGAAPRRRRSRARRNPAEVAASRKLQGVYLSLIKQVPQAKRDQFRKIAGSAGREEAIRKMRAVLGK